MEGIHSEFQKANKLIEVFFKDDKFKNRYASLLNMMKSFVEHAGLSQQVSINELILAYALVDYFEDIMRLKEFHDVEHVNSIKIVSYTSYWLLRAKPMQINSVDKKLLYINERFVLSYIMTALEDETKGRVLQRKSPGLKAFSESLFYFLKYRATSAQSLELALISFLAGRIYQETNEDISDKMGKMNF